MTGQSPYDLARLLDEYPDVFDAYWVRAVGLLSKSAEKGKARQSFRERREATRAERITRAARRR